MKSSEIIEYLEKNGLSEVEEINITDEYILIKFFYDFDKEEIDAAENYANEDCDFDDDSDEWYNDFYMPYLNDIAMDNIESIIEEAMEDLDIEGKYRQIESETRNLGYVKFISVFANSDSEVDLDEVLIDYND
ncbi:hypothetical protein FDB55_04270 [Clostridium botulinum]|uniref:Uncharacterized protein n=2 Tax=Clostridium botulinum TaxID=1491 RepID=A0A0C2N3L7_CLOBO|nr:MULTISPECIES: hypothetical protein [Clostridium]ACD53647.1 conserved hypothetical protein [Clostridium botulinum E3 str. Alaska E43]AJF30414.1 hypothetical protein ST13_12130 [Clostridium botulinum]AJF33477.1 hypothetical protein ST12_12130 [Clostridium botulinum]KAI3346561.1 hypothetical protein CIT18_14330 [Clostridium botulinum]KIL07655.1 hypothetical protein SR42_00995 [Clostridium botulinum]